MNDYSNGYNQFKGDNDPEIPRVMVQQPYTATPTAAEATTFIVDATAPAYVRWTWCHMVTAIISIFCCQIFGIIATASALMSYTDHKAKDFDRSRTKRNMAYGFGIAGIVIGCIGLIILIIVFATMGAVIIQSEDSFNHQINEFNNEYSG